MSWKRVGDNLVRWNGGTIYLRKKVGGKLIRHSLETSDLRIAKLKRDQFLNKLIGGDEAVDNYLPLKGRRLTLGAFIESLEAEVTTQPHLRPETVRYYREMFSILKATMPIDRPAKAWSGREAALWWRQVAEKYSAQRANNVLGMAKRLTARLQERGLRMDDPCQKLRRVRIVPRTIEMLSKEDMDAVIQSIREQGKAHSEASADFVGFLAYSGCRLGQATALQWKHVGEDWIAFEAGVSGSKRANARKLPISPPLREILERMKARAKDAGPEDALFYMNRPHEALKAACSRLNLPHMRVHDLRHFFATFSLERGVDVPTVAKWLGHSDGGALVLRTYGHARDEHSQRCAELLA